MLNHRERKLRDVLGLLGRQNGSLMILKGSLVPPSSTPTLICIPRRVRMVHAFLTFSSMNTAVRTILRGSNDWKQYERALMRSLQAFDHAHNAGVC
jgi:hypothetical protein